MLVLPEPYIIDTSVWHKAPVYPRIAARFRAVLNDHTVLATPPQALEYCYSAISVGEYHERFRPKMDALIPAPNHPSMKDALDLQQALWDSQLFRAAQAMDTLIGAYAVANDATVLCADQDYLHLQTASRGRLKVEYLETR